MRKNLTLVLAVSTMIAASAAVTNYNGSGGDMHIMGAGSSSASTGVSPNGTQYQVEISYTGSSNATNESVELTDSTNRSVSFNGVIRSPTPCHTITYHEEKQNNSISVDLSMRPSNRSCTQQVVMKSYEGKVEADGLEEITINHRGEQMEVFETTEPDSAEEKSSESGAPLDVLVRLLQGLF